MPKIFGSEHIIYLVVYVLLFVVSFFLLFRKKRTERTHTFVRKSVALVLLLSVAINRVCIMLYNYEVGNDTSYNLVRLIPESFCGVCNVLFALSVLCLKKEHPIFHFLPYLAIYGGALNTIYPTYIGQMDHFLYPATITGMIHHSVALFLAVYLLATGFVRPTMKKFYLLPLGFCTFITWGVFLLDLFPDLANFNPMNLAKPFVEGTFLTWYVVGAMVVAVHFLVLCVFSYFNKRNSKSE